MMGKPNTVYPAVSSTYRRQYGKGVTTGGVFVCVCSQAAKFYQEFSSNKGLSPLLGHLGVSVSYAATQSESASIALPVLACAIMFCASLSG